MTWRVPILSAIISTTFGVLADFIFWSPKDGVSSQTKIEAYRNQRISHVPAEFHADTDNAGASCWPERRREFLRQMDFKGQSGAEVSGLSRFSDDSARACYEKVSLWPDGKVPDFESRQCVPYLEWHLPKISRTRAVMIVFSGGGYEANSTDGNSVPPVRRYLNAKGMAVVTLKYRTPRPSGLAKHMTAWQDLQRTIRIVRSAAGARGLDAKKIGVWGGSAGGHLALLGALSSSRAAYRSIDATDRMPCDVQLAVVLFPAYVLSDGFEGKNERGGNDPDVCIAGEFAFDEKSCPVLFLHGDADSYSAMGSVLVWNRLRTMGVSSAVHTFALRGHDFQYAAAPGTASYNYLDIVWNYMNQVGFVNSAGTKPAKLGAVSHPLHPCRRRRQSDIALPFDRGSERGSDPNGGVKVVE